MGNGVSRVDIGKDAHMSREVASGVFFRYVALIQNDLGLDTSLVSINQSLCDILTGKAISLNQYLLFALPKGFIEESKAFELSNLLQRSYMVEGLWEQFNADPEKKKDLPIIAEASGIFLALSNSVKAGYKPGG